MPYGVTSAGFVLKPLQQILADIEARQKATIAADLDVSPDQPIGQINGIVAAALAQLWEIAQNAYNAFDRDKAEGDALENLGKLTGTAKAPAQKATAPCTLVFSGPATLTAGTHFVQLDTDPTVQFTPLSDVVVTVAGTLTDVVFQAQNAGPVDAASGHLTVIATPVPNWVSCTNTAGASGGLPADDDNALRLKMVQDLERTGSSTVDAIRDDVLALNESSDPPLTTIQSVTVFENVSDVVDANGLPPHSFEVLVYDGDTPDAGNADKIAGAIWKSKPAGIRPFGALTGTTHDEQGNPEDVQFSRATTKTVWLEFQLGTDSSYVGDAQFQQIVADEANSVFSRVGLDVIASKLVAIAFDVPGVSDVVSLTLGFTASPTGTTNLVIDDRELARFDAARITNI